MYIKAIVIIMLKYVFGPYKYSEFGLLVTFFFEIHLCNFFCILKKVFGPTFLMIYIYAYVADDYCASMKIIIYFFVEKRKEKKKE